MADNLNLQASEQTTIRTEFTECINKSFEKKETSKTVNQQTFPSKQNTSATNEETKTKYQSKNLQEKVPGKSIKENEDNLRNWQSSLDAACHLTDTITPFPSATTSTPTPAPSVPPRERIIPISLGQASTEGQVIPGYISLSPGGNYVIITGTNRENRDREGCAYSAASGTLTLTLVIQFLLLLLLL